MPYSSSWATRITNWIGGSLASPSPCVGKDYFTVEGMLRRVRESMRSHVHASHLAQVWQWKGLTEGDMPGATRRMHNLDPVHAFRFTRDPGGIWMQWKQWCTDDSWSAGVQIHQRH